MNQPSLPSSHDIQETLRRVFGFRGFRPHQQEIVESLLNGNDVFAVMPTGGGKSLCYQLPAKILPGAAVIVSPLIALMKDQVDGAAANGLSTGTLNSSTSGREKAGTWRALHTGELDLLYVSPERLLANGFLEELAGCDISFFAIDEAHCVSEWGHDFRPDYLGLEVITRQFPGKPMAAFTATATRKVADDIISRLGLRSPMEVRASFNRPNLYYQAEPRTDFEKQAMAVIKQYPGESGIIYRATRKSVESTTGKLLKLGLKVKAYHAGMSTEERNEAQDDFRLDRCQVIVATVAFGMGIDKSNVRFVIHGDLPKNLESYYQETGRAGRDGEPAHCALFYGSQEMVLWRRFADDLTSTALRDSAINQLKQMIRFVQMDGCRRKALLEYFGEKLHTDDCGGCDICRGEVERMEATVEAQMAISAMVRCGGRFGSTHLADVLLGSDTARVRDNGHHLLPTYGVGRDYDRNFWRDLMENLIVRGLAERADGQYPTLAASPRAWPLLRGEEKFFMLRTAVKSRPRRAMEEERDGLSMELFGRLKETRKRLAFDAGIAPYLVFSDRSLREMAQSKPMSNSEFLNINGVGQRKMESYGPEFLAIIAEYLEEHPEEMTGRKISPDSFSKATERVRGEGRAVKGETIGHTAELLDEGRSLAEIAQLRDLTLRTVVGHLEKLVETGHDLPSARFISDELLGKVSSYLAANNDETSARPPLKPIVEALNISYEEAVIGRAFSIRQAQSSG